jgi:hypothetical protein
MTHMDTVSTFKLRNPLPDLVLMEADDLAEQLIFPSWLSAFSEATGRKE